MKLLLSLFGAVVSCLCFGQGNIDGRQAIQSQQSGSSTSTQYSLQDRQTGSEEMILPYLSIKSNLLHDATTSMNLGFEVRTGYNTSLDVPVTYNPWTFSDNKKWKHILIQPEFRFWPDQTFKGHFFGVHGHYAFYNVGGLPNPPFSEYMNTHRFEGWLAGGGLSYGYRLNFDHRWGVEATIGVGYAYLSYDKYECAGCGKWLESETKNYFGPTRAGITLIYSIGGKGKPKVKRTPPPVSTQAPILTTGIIIPEVEEVKARSSEIGKAYLEFEVARSEILHNFRNNASELNRVHELVRQVVNDPDATITNITISGYASPEGSYSSNLSLSQRRATAFKEYIKSMYSLNDYLFTVWGAGEDWETLDSLVSQSNITDKQHILDIIRSSEPHDARENRLMAIAGGRPYRQVFTEMYPQLRRMECQLHYTVVPFTVEKGKEIFRTRPNNLSLNEMFLIAQTYPSGSAEYNEIFETAARLYPNNDIANINAAASAIGRKDFAAAARYLDGVKEQSVYYWNNRGVLLFMQGDKRRAMDCFAKGGVQGAGNIARINNP
jgi:outer membrane protein OmpA-like peptidoglycan-associated protein